MTEATVTLMLLDHHRFKPTSEGWYKKQQAESGMLVVLPASAPVILGPVEIKVEVGLFCIRDPACVAGLGVRVINVVLTGTVPCSVRIRLGDGVVPIPYLVASFWLRNSQRIEGSRRNTPKQKHYVQSS